MTIFSSNCCFLPTVGHVTEDRIDGSIARWKLTVLETDSYKWTATFGDMYVLCDICRYMVFYDIIDIIQ